MRRPKTALVAAILGAASAASFVAAQQLPRGQAPTGDSAGQAAASPTSYAMASARGPRSLIRNAQDYMELGEFDRALRMLREAETRQNLLNDAEKRVLVQAIADAQKGLRSPENMARANAPRDRSARRPGSIALAPASSQRSDVPTNVHGADPIEIAVAPDPTPVRDARDRAPRVLPGLPVMDPDTTLASTTQVQASATSMPALRTQSPEPEPARVATAPATDLPPLPPETTALPTSSQPTVDSTSPSADPFAALAASNDPPKPAVNAPVQAPVAQIPVVEPPTAPPVIEQPTVVVEPPATAPVIEQPVAKPASSSLPLVPASSDLAIPASGAVKIGGLTPPARPADSDLVIPTSGAEPSAVVIELPPSTATAGQPPAKVNDPAPAKTVDEAALEPVPLPTRAVTTGGTPDATPASAGVFEAPGTQAPAAAQPVVALGRTPDANVNPVVDMSTMPTPVPLPLLPGETEDPTPLHTEAAIAAEAAARQSSNSAPASVAADLGVAPPERSAASPAPGQDAPGATTDPVRDSRPATAAEDISLPPLPTERPRSRPAPRGASNGESANGGIRLTPSRLSTELQSEVDQIARLQNQRERQNPPATGMPPTMVEDSVGKLELSRAPSPTEARAIRPIPVPDEFVPLAPRQWSPTRKYFIAVGTCHMPLYFQNPVLERYGQSVEVAMGPAGRWMSYPLDDPTQSKQRNQLLEPLFGAGLFMFQLGTVPYRMIVDPPWEPEYDLGYYRPGDRIPPDTYYLPIHGIGPPLRGNNY